MFTILRPLHIIAGIIWAGSAILTGLIIGPAMAATGDAGKQFAAHLMKKTAFSNLMAGSGIITVLAGTVLYGIDSNWFSSGWMMSGQGIGFGVGAVAGIFALVLGIMLGNTNKSLVALGGQIQGKPTDEQMTAMQQLRKHQAVVGPANMIFMLISVFFMASARFFG